MRPVIFDGCFGWLHQAPGRHGVVLCNPFGYDALCTHRGWRRLAERIAEAGMPVLRFDYPGTGDSSRNEDDPGRVDAWIDSIVAAVRHLIQATGVNRVSLCGLRLGATLAALAAERLGDIDGLVLLSSPLSGRNYLRELRAHRQSWMSTTAGMNADSIPDTEAYVEAFGFGFHGDDIARLGAIDLRADTRSPARRVLLLDSSDRARGTALVEHYASNGVQVERHAFEEADRFFVEALYSEEPVNAFSIVGKWLGKVADSDSDAVAATAATADALNAQQVEMAAGAFHAQPPRLILEREQASEHPVLFGCHFGIYCRPDVPREGVPAVLFFNTGASHHIGDGRIFVLFARALAAQGIASLRMDLGGLGDSTPAVPAVTLDMIYSAESAAGAMAGADWLVHNGFPRVVTFGVCGGAFVGLHACAADPRIVGCFGVNLQKFIWDGADRTPGTDGLASTRVLRRSALRLDKWMRVLRGQTSIVRVVRGLAQRASRRMCLRVAELIDDTTGVSIAPNPVRRLLSQLDAKGAQVRLVYGDFDLGLDELKIQFGPRLRALRRFSRVSAVTLPKLDHALFTRPAREVAMADAQSWFFERFVRAPAVETSPDERQAIPMAGRRSTGDHVAYGSYPDGAPQ
ncbi:pimeloyl-ACP methyl ester carboxylesterase [Paraburkholderia sp. GAS448]|uniref:alpha/beta fold hydrolase n=1 Tax=Paraburkholderia sp. GAS448 TaxID=3035136 RepID=UPI003D19EB41